MTEVNYTYSNEEYGWVSDEITLTKDAVLLVSLKKKGIVVVKQKMGSEWPKAFCSRKTTEEEITLDIIGNENRVIKVITSEEPNNIKYANIQR